MFQTLKARRGNSGASEYVVQSAGAPFEKTRKQPACKFCKQKKLRCIADADSCVACRKQGIECSYAGAGTQSKTLPAADSEPEKEAQPSTRVNGETAKSSAKSNPPALIHDDLAFSETFEFPEMPDYDPCFDFSALPDGGVHMDEMDVYLCAGEDQGRRQDGTAVPLIQNSEATQNTVQDHILGYSKAPDGGATVTTIASSHSTSPSPFAESSGWDSDILQEPQATPSAQLSDTFPQGHPPYAGLSRPDHRPMGHLPSLSTACHCPEQIMCANETMQVKLVWGASTRKGPPLSVDDMLQCLKDILASCETLLDCSSCRLRSDYVMLIVSMCHEMMNGIWHLDSMTSPGRQHQSLKRARSDSRAGSVTTVDGGLKAGGWRFNDEDEMQVMRSLLGIRVKRLGSLITQLEKVVNAHHSTYEWIVSALRQVILEKEGSMGPGRGGGIFASNSQTMSSLTKAQ